MRRRYALRACSWAISTVHAYGEPADRFFARGVVNAKAQSEGVPPALRVTASEPTTRLHAFGTRLATLGYGSGNAQFFNQLFLEMHISQEVGAVLWKSR